MPADHSWDIPFTTDDTHHREFLACVKDLVGESAPDRPLQVLYVGCGDGGKVMQLAEWWPRARFTGVDISAPCIHLADQRRRANPNGERVRFLQGDYLAVPLGRFDLILGNSVLHLIPGSTSQLFDKLAGELNPGGLLVFTMPYACWYNMMLSWLRRTLRLFRSRVTDWLLLTLVSRWHRHSYSFEFLRERLNYAYLLARRVGSPALEKRLLERHHLAVQAMIPYAHASLGQYKHRLWCFRYQPPTPALLPERLPA